MSQPPSCAQAPPARIAGLIVPLFSIPSSESWGIGELTDLPRLAVWMKRAGLGLLQILPLNEMAAWTQSPYSALSAMAIDPIYVSVRSVEDFVAMGGERAMPGGWRDDLARARASRSVDYALVRRVKEQALRVAFSGFLARHWERQSGRAASLAEWAASERWWVDDYSLFRAIHASRGEQSWTRWPEGLRKRGAEALAEARVAMAEEVLYRTYVQWIADGQWAQARADAAPVAVFGDLPFMVDADSADVWARQEEFRLDASVGAPPDAFSDDGQDWGLPACDWVAMERSGFQWMAGRARRAARLYDGFRIDHVVGLYRTFTILADKSARFFNPSAEADQLALGERLVSLFAGFGVTLVAEDLGTVPDFVRASLDRMGIPGFKVFRWEREWHAAGRPFRDPAGYPPVSLATTGTHDTETLAEWWDAMDEEERRAVMDMPALGRRAGEQGIDLGAPFGPSQRDLLLTILFESAAALVIVPVQDLFGWRDRVNVPATVTATNWVWRLPWPVDRLDQVAEAEARAAETAALVASTGRLGPFRPAR